MMKHDETCELNWVKITADSVGWAFHICFALSDSKLDTPRSGPLIRWDITVCEEKRLAPVGDGNREIWKGQSMSEYDLEISWIWKFHLECYGLNVLNFRHQPSFESLMQFSGWAEWLCSGTRPGSKTKLADGMCKFGQQVATTRRHILVSQV